MRRVLRASENLIGRIRLPPAVLFAAFLTSACDELPSLGQSEAEVACASDEICGAAENIRVRSIKSYVVTQIASGAERRFSGEIASANAAPLSFPVTGQVTAIAVAAGDRVEKDATLATLDSAPLVINVQSARADLNAAQSAERALRTDLDRQRELRKNGWVSQAALDQSEAEYQNARSQVSVAQSRVTLAERDLASTRMSAPFAGVVSKTEVEPFTEVRAGQTIMIVQSGDAFEVVVSVPEAVISDVATGSPVAIDIATLPLCGCRGNVIEIGAVTSAGNTVDVKVAVTDAPTGLRAGMSAEVAMTIGRAERTSGYFVPLSAIAPGGDAEAGSAKRRYASSAPSQLTRSLSKGFKPAISLHLPASVSCEMVNACAFWASKISARAIGEEQCPLPNS